MNIPTVSLFGIIDFFHFQIPIKENCLPASGELIRWRLRAQVEINVWPNNDLIIFPGLLMLDPEQESPQTEGRLWRCGEGADVTGLPRWTS